MLLKSCSCLAPSQAIRICTQAEPNNCLECPCMGKVWPYQTSQADLEAPRRLHRQLQKHRPPVSNAAVAAGPSDLLSLEEHHTTKGWLVSYMVPKSDPARAVCQNANRELKQARCQQRLESAPPHSSCPPTARHSAAILSLTEHV